MDADWSVELGADDPALEVPWRSPDGSQRFVDLLSHTEAIDDIPEAMRYEPLRQFLVVLNGNDAPWQTAKCDVWLENQGDAMEIESSQRRMCSYVDIVRRDSLQRFSFEQHEAWVRAAAARLQLLGDERIVCELVVRRCYFHIDVDSANDSNPGFHVTVYVSGYGKDETEALARWSQGLRVVSSALIE